MKKQKKGTNKKAKRTSAEVARLKAELPKEVVRSLLQ